MDASDRALREGLDGTARSSVIVALSVARGPRGSETRGSWQPALEASAHWGPEATGPKASPEEYNAVDSVRNQGAISDGDDPVFCVFIETHAVHAALRSAAASRRMSSSVFSRAAAAVLDLAERAADTVPSLPTVFPPLH